MPEPSPQKTLFIGTLALADEVASALPLEHTSVTAQVVGPLASVTVTQRFGNPLTEPAELDYLFPLPHKAAITGFELHIGARRVNGELREVEQARADYEAGKQAGQRAGLLEQRRPNLFAVRLANVLPGEAVHATLRYQERLRFEDGAFEFVFPMGITPKYGSPDHPEESQGVQPPIALPGELIGPVEIQAAVDAGVEVGEPSSPSHPLEVIRLDERRFQVRLAGEHIPDHDFVLRYAARSQEVTGAAWTTPSPLLEKPSPAHDTAGAEPAEPALPAAAPTQIFLASLLPPPLDEDYTPAPREFIFVLDRSGSMSGEPIAQARNALRACLRSLNAGDTFRILLFDDMWDWYKPEPVHLTQAEIDQADAFLEQVQGRGGTEIVPALEAALGLPPDPRRARFVVFLTDGAVSAEERLLARVRRMLGPARLFTFGIGPSVNRALLHRMAELGRGKAEFLQLDEDIEGAILRFQDRVSFPLLTDLRLEWEHAEAWEVYPRLLPDLYAGDPLEVVGRFRPSDSQTADRPVALVLHARRGGEKVRLRLMLPPAVQAEPLIARAWGRARIDDLDAAREMDPSRADALQEEIVRLALASGLATAYTAFVAVDSEPATAGGEPRQLHVSQPVPQGLIREAFTVQSKAMLQAKFFSSAPPAPGTTGAVPPDDLLSTQRASFDMHLSERHLPRYHPAPPPHPKSPQLDVDPFSTEQAPAASEQPDTAQQSLRRLARQQLLDGSWGGDGELTAAALLAFVRAGHTTRAGSFRQVVRRAAAWLSAASLTGFAALVRAAALRELAAATGQEEHRRLAAEAAENVGAQLENSGRSEDAPLAEPLLPAAARLLAGEGSAKAPTAIHSLDDLRLAGLLRLALPVPAALLNGPHTDLARAWAAAMIRT